MSKQNFSAASSAVGTVAVELVAAGDAMTPFLTNLILRPDTGDEVTIRTITGSRELFKTTADVDLPSSFTLRGDKGEGIEIIAAANTSTFVECTGEYIGRGAPQIYSGMIEEDTANGTTVYAVIRTPLTTTEVNEVHMVHLDTEAGANQTVAFGYDDDGAGTNFVALTPLSTGGSSYDLGGFQVPAGKYLVIENIEGAAGGAKKAWGNASWTRAKA
jgi:hypothetical protein